MQRLLGLRILVAVVVLGLLGAAAGLVVYKMFPAQMAKYGGMARSTSTGALTRRRVP